MSNGEVASTPYVAPVGEIMTALRVVGLEELLARPYYQHVDESTVDSVLKEFGRMATEVIAQSDRVGDQVGATFDHQTRTVTVPDEYKKSYDLWVQSGFGALPLATKFGGGGFPSVVAAAMQEMFASASMSLSLNPTLTQSAIEALVQWGSEEQRALYLDKLSTGEWSGTMNLTEPQAGSDLGTIQTLATPQPDSSWQISGTKIFITWGEHDLTPNIIHLVLARTPGAEAGTKGLSMFLVPKFLVNPDGSLGEHNNVYAQRLEEKLGIHGSPTCVMNYDGAVGYLVGPLHGGMRAMFTMMNAARLAIGIEGPAVAERAYQHAWDYAHNRPQGRAHGVQPPAQSLIVEHPDIQRLLLLMRTSTLAARLLIFFATAQKDIAHDVEAPDAAIGQAMVDLLTPIAKAWSTDRGFEAASWGVQIFGGMGFIEETGIAQRLRDARIAPIYEGTNGIQALDLVFRKISVDGGKWVKEVLHNIQTDLETTTNGQRKVIDAVAELEQVTYWMLEKVANSPEDAQAGATAYLELFGNVLGAWLLYRRAAVLKSDQSLAEAEFFALEFVAARQGLSHSILAGHQRLTCL
jgi:3-(methylthio)propanoyl-CoA dehydrogenase